MDEVTEENLKSLSEVREQLQEDIEHYWEGFPGPFTFTHEDQESFDSDMCDIVTNRLNQFIEQQPVSQMTMELYHGRTDPEQDMQDWGSQGPVLFVDGVTVTYGGSIRIMFTGQDDYEFLEEYLLEDMFFYDGVYYGDFAFQPVDSGRQNVGGQQAGLFDPNKALKKEKQG